MIEVFVTDQNDVRLVRALDFVRVGINDLRADNAKGVVRNARKVQIQKFHAWASFLTSPF
jgi:hypothetical protein